MSLSPISWGLLLIAAAAAPTVLRRRTLVSSASRPRLDPGTASGRSLLIPILHLQDWVVSSILALIVSLLARAAAAPFPAALLAASILTLYHLLLLVDSVLLTRLNLRLSPHFLTYAGQLDLFSKSSRKIGVDLRLLFGGLCLYFAILLIGFWNAFGTWGVPAGTAWTLPALAFLFLAGWATTRAVPADQAVYLLNLILFRQVELFRKKDRASLDNPEEILTRFLRNEQHVLLAPASPLLRHSLAYRGPRHFELNLKPADRPDVILLFLESFCSATIGVIGQETGASPEFNRFSKQGILFRNFHGNGVQTARAVISSLFGIPPRLTEAPAQSDLRHCPRLLGIPHLFEELGYRNLYLHNGGLEFERQDAFFPRHRYHELHGVNEMQKAFPQAQDLGGWGIPDEYLMRYFVERLGKARAARSPSFSTLFSITNHFPFEIPPGFAPLPFEFPGNPEKEMFLQTFAYTDQCLKLLVQLLEERGLFENTLLFVLGDTGQPLGEHDNWVEQKFLFDENLRVPLLILGPSFVREPMVIDDPSSQLDLFATFLDLFQKPFYNHSIGGSLTRVNPSRPVHFNNPFGNQLIGERIGRLKIIHELRTAKTVLYDLIDDPGETTDVSANHQATVDPWKEKLLRSNALFQHLYQKDGFC